MSATEATEAEEVAAAEKELARIKRAFMDGDASASEVIAAEEAVEVAMVRAARAEELNRNRRQAQAKEQALKAAADMADRIATEVSTFSDELDQAAAQARDALAGLYDVAQRRAAFASRVVAEAEGLVATGVDVPVAVRRSPEAGTVVHTKGGAVANMPAVSFVLAQVAEALHGAHPEDLGPEGLAVLNLHRLKVQRAFEAQTSHVPLGAQAEAVQREASQKARERRRQQGLLQTRRAEYLGQLQAIDNASQANRLTADGGHDPSRQEWLEKHPDAPELFGLTPERFLAADMAALRSKQ